MDVQSVAPHLQLASLTASPNLFTHGESCGTGTLFVLSLVPPSLLLLPLSLLVCEVSTVEAEAVVSVVIALIDTDITLLAVILVLNCSVKESDVLK